MFRTEQVNELYSEKSLEAFWATVKTGRLQEAASMLSVTQPAISAAIKKIEVNLGVPLLERGGYKKIALTKEGKKLFLFAEKYFSNLSKNVLHESSLLSDTYSVGVSSMLPQKKLNNILSNIAISNVRHAHLLKINFEIKSTYEIVAGFENKDYDCVFIPHMGRDVCLSIQADIHPLSESETYSVYMVKAKHLVGSESDKNLGFVAVENFAMINLLPKDIHKTVIYENVDELFYKSVCNAGYIVLNPQQASILTHNGFSIEKCNEVESEEVNFGYCYRMGAQGVIQKCLNGY